MLVTVTNENKPEICWEFRQDPKSGRMSIGWLKDGTQDQVIAALQEALEEAKHQFLWIK